jgi:hypothetical protein
MPPETELLKWSVQLGGPLLGLAVLVLVMYRRDMIRMQKDSEKREDLLLEVLRTNVSAMTGMKDSIDRVARALEGRGV